MIGVFLQARLHSARLPKKIILPLGSSTVIQMAMRALRSIHADVYAVLCDTKSLPILYPLTRKEGFRIIAGSTYNVLDRFLFAADVLRVSTIIRATGDNPFVSAKLANLLLKDKRTKGADYAGYSGMPVGTGVEKVRVTSLKEVACKTTNSYEREHVCPYLYTHPDIFRITILQAQNSYLKNTRVTLDTKSDYKNLQSIILKRKNPCTDAPLEIDELLSILNKGITQ